MDENHQDKTGSKPLATVDDLWLPPLSPQDQKKLDRLRKDRKKAKQPLIVIGISAAFVGVIALVDIRFRFNWSLRVGVSMPLWVWVLISLMLIEIVLLFLFIRTGNTTQWTGVRGYDKITKEYTPDGQLARITKVHQPGKTFWDWLQLLIIPIILASATIGFGLWQAHLADLQHQSDQVLAQQQHQSDQTLAQQQHDADQQQALDQQQAAILQTYIDNIQDLLLNHNLLKSKPDGEIAILARARTLTALEGLDPHRKRRLLIFLYEAELIGFDDNNSKTHDPIINLTGANLDYADLSGAKLSGASLSGANFYKAELSNARLSNAKLMDAFLMGAFLDYATLTGADLRGAYLYHAKLSHANLTGADLTDAFLRGVQDKADFTRAKLIRAFLYGDFTGANFIGADLTGAKLYEAEVAIANLTQRQLDQVYSCKNAILPPGSGLTCHRNQ